jgi:hypothetical protein
MEKDRRVTWIAGLLIGVGVFNLLVRAGWMAGVGGWLWGLFFLAGGGVFLWFYTRDRQQWWAVFPGFGLIGLAAAVLMGNAGGALFLALLGLAFAVVYSTDRRRWWAILPAGALATLALVAWLGTVRPAYDAGWVFFLGLAATFAALLLQQGDQRQRWAAVPALALALLALLTLFTSQAGPTVIALALIALGAVLVLRDRPLGRGGAPRGGKTS